MMTDLRIGYGIDIHQLQPEYPLILGGVRLPSDKGLKGHSDADVLLHAICDAMLGALALGDIGTHFPDTDPQYKGIDSRKLLRHVYRLIQERGYSLVNLDSTICMELPKVKPYIDAMRNNIAEDLKADISQISIKATTTEKLGYEGRREGVTAHCTVLIQKDKTE